MLTKQYCAGCNALISKHGDLEEDEDDVCAFPEPEWRYDFKILLRDPAVAINATTKVLEENTIEVVIRDDPQLFTSKDSGEDSLACFFEVPPIDFSKNKASLQRLREHIKQLLAWKQPLEFVVTGEEEADWGKIRLSWVALGTQITILNR